MIEIHVRINWLFVCILLYLEILNFKSYGIVVLNGIFLLNTISLTEIMHKWENARWLKLVNVDFGFAISFQKLRDNLGLPALGATQRWEGLFQPDGDERITEGF